MSCDIPMRDLVRCVERELRLRKSVYPRRVANGKMSSAVAAREIAAMSAVLDTMRQQPGAFAQESLFKPNEADPPPWD